MKRFILCIPAMLLLAACAQNPQQAALMQALGQDLMADGMIGQRQTTYHPQPIPQPQRVTCQKFGNQVNCRSW